MIEYSELDLDYNRVNLVFVDNSNILVATLNEEYMHRLRRYFQNEVKHAKWSNNYKNGLWDGRIRFLQNNGLLPSGLLNECTEILKEWGVTYQLDNFPHDQIDISDFRDVINDEMIAKQQGEPMIPYDHQWETAELLLQSRRGITKSATSSGKSFVITMVAKYLLHKKHVSNILLVVPRSDLVLQMLKDSEEYGFDRKDTGIYFGREKDYKGKKFVIATWQSLNEIKHRKFFEQFECLIIDECHGAKQNDKSSKSKLKSGGTVMRQICDLCTNASWRFGFSGTLPTDPLEKRTVISGIGPVINEVKAVDLMEKGLITKLKISIPFINYDNKIANEKIKDILLANGITPDMKLEDIPITAKFNAEKQFLENYIPRLKLISKIVKSRLEKEENILILANTLKFGENLKKILSHLLKNDFNEIYYIRGDMNEYDRKAIREDMEKKTRVIIIATTSLFSTGISVKNLHSAVFSSIGKSKTRCIQSIGRILRLHSSKKVARVYDLVDNLKYSKKHAQERLNYYIEEEYDHEIYEVSI